MIHAWIDEEILFTNFITLGLYFLNDISKYSSIEKCLVVTFATQYEMHDLIDFIILMKIFFWETV